MAEFDKTNVPGYQKHKRKGFVINTNASELAAFRKQRKLIKERNQLEKDLLNMKKEMDDQKLLLQKILLEVGILKAGTDK
jgi:hypothetical protein